MMDWKAYLRTYLPPPTGDPARDEDILDELAEHLADDYAERRAAGIAEAEARAQTAAQIGGRMPDVLRRLSADIRRADRPRPGGVPVPPAAASHLLADFWHDLGYAARLLRRSPGFTAVAVLTLALGIGATTAIFSVVHAVLLRPLPYGDPHRLVRIFEVTPRGDDRNVVSPGNYLDWRERATAFDGMGAHSWVFGMGLTGGGDPVRVQVARITPAALRVLDTRPVLGRTFTDAEGGPGGPPVALLSHRFWRQRFSGDTRVLDRTISLDDDVYAVAGVMPPGFDFPTPLVDVWLPLRFDAADRDERRSHNQYVIARLRSGVPLERAASEMRAIAASIAETWPQYMTGWSVNVVPLRADLVENVRPLLLTLLGVVGLVLLIACANLTNLLLMRSTSRAHEVAVRAALGASRGRMVRQLLAESLLLACLGAGLGVGVVALVLDGLLAAAPADIPLIDDVRIDLAVLGAALGLTLASTLLVGLAPAMRAARADLRSPLSASRRSGADPGHSRLRSGLLVAEVAVALVLLVGAGLLVRSFRQLQAVDYGFAPDGLLAVSLDLPRSRYPDRPQQLAFYRELLERVAALPGVAGAAGTTEPPIVGFQQTFSFAIRGRPAVNPTGREDPVPLRVVTPGFFRTTAIPIVRGRTFDDRDREGAPAVVLINEALAARHWPDADPIGQQISFQGQEGPWREIVGIVGDTRHDGLDRPAGPAMYLPHAQRRENWAWMSWLTLMVRARSGVDPAALAPDLRSAVWALDEALPIHRVETVEQLYAESAGRRRFAMLLVAVFAGLALVLGSIGVYGVLSYSVAQRRQEIGVRMALGARRGQVAAAVVGQAVGLTMVGIGLGVAGALAATRLIRSLLFAVSPTDPATFATMVVLVLAVAALAAYIPARRAARVDPVAVLRAE